MTGKAVVGPLTGKSLKWIPSEVTTWAEWLKRHPGTTVLKPPRGPDAYRRSGYARYRANDDALFPLPESVRIERTYKNKDSVTIVVIDGKARCYPHPALKEGVNEDGDLRIIKKGISVTVKDKDGKEVPSLFAYWFSWWAFYPEGTVWEKPG